MRLVDTNYGFQGDAIRLSLNHANVHFEDQQYDLNAIVPSGLQEESKSLTGGKFPRLYIPGQEPIIGLVNALSAIGYRYSLNPLFDDYSKCFELLQKIEVVGGQLTEAALSGVAKEECAKNLATIFAAANKYLEDNALSKHLACFGNANTIIDFAVLGLYLSALEHEVTNSLVKSSITKEMSFLKSFLEHHNKVLTSYFIKSGRHVVCYGNSVDARVAQILAQHAKLPIKVQEAPKELGTDGIRIGDTFWPQLDVALYSVFTTLNYIPTGKEVNLADVLKPRQICRDILLLPEDQRNMKFIGWKVDVADSFYKAVDGYFKLISPKPCLVGGLYFTEMANVFSALPEGKKMLEEHGLSFMKYRADWIKRHGRKDSCVLVGMGKESKAVGAEALYTTYPYSLACYLTNMGYKKVICETLSASNLDSALSSIIAKNPNSEILIFQDQAKLPAEGKVVLGGCSSEFLCIGKNKVAAKEQLTAAACPVVPFVAASSLAELASEETKALLAFPATVFCSEKGVRVANYEEMMGKVQEGMEAAKGSKIMIRWVEYKAT